METLEELIGPRFDKALERIWTKLLGLLSGEMLHGAAEAETAETVDLNIGDWN